MSPYRWLYICIMGGMLLAGFIGLLGFLASLLLLAFIPKDAGAPRPPREVDPDRSWL